MTEQISKEEQIRLILDFFHRTMMHHAIWFSEVRHQYGMEKALEIMNEAYQSSYDIQLKRLAKTLGFEMTGDVPAPMLAMSNEKLAELRESVALNWLATDGVWFLAVEKKFGMFDAKRCNDSSWGKFSPVEAWSIKRLLKMEEHPGLDGLKKALQYRLYATINKQEIIEETPNSFVFRMVDCRVQSARKRKGLEDYPCKSAGIVEYRTFAETIDSHIKTEIVSCPPDVHPDNYYCAWKFFVDRG